MKFRKKPEVVAAIQWNGNDRRTDEIYDFTDERCYRLSGVFGTLYILTSNGERIVNEGDWIVKDANGEISTVKWDIFDRYELVEE